MDRKSVWASGALVGAGLMALLDPNRGRTRRALLRNKANAAAGAVGTAAGKTWRDLRHRAEGVASQGRAMISGEAERGGPLDARVRSRLGRLTSHPRAITVEALDGRVVLSGPVLAREADAVLAGVRAVRGVSEVEDRLQRHERADGIPALQGPGRARRRGRLGEHWPPALRLAGGVAGAGLVVAGARRRDWIGGGMAIAGLAVLSRAASNRPLRRMLRLGRSRSSVDVRKSIEVNAPIARAYEFWRRWENFPRFFEHVREVRDEGSGWTRWKVAGPGGVDIVFDAVVTATIPNHLIAWKTAPRQAVRQSGLVRFDESAPGRTRIEVQMSYTPPAGQLGHAVAALFGADPGSALDDDLFRLKSLLEQGGTQESGRERETAATRGDAVRPSESARVASSGPVAESSEPVAESSEPVAESSEPVAESSEPVQAASSHPAHAASSQSAASANEASSAPFLGEPPQPPAGERGTHEEDHGARVPVEFTTPVPREESLEPRPEEAIVAAQDAGVEPLIQTEPGQGAGPADTGAAPASPAADSKPGRRSRKKRPPQPPPDQVDF